MPTTPRQDLSLTEGILLYGTVAYHSYLGDTLIWGTRAVFTDVSLLPRKDNNVV